MAIRRIVTIDEPLLRKRSKKVHTFDSNLKALADDMLETMHASDGLGLAAPQIGVLQRVVVIQLPEEYEMPEAGELFILVNPEIKESGGEQLIGEEMCLSIPGIVGEVPRAEKVTVKAQTLKGKTIKIKAEGFLARVFQHELDHLDGTLFVDRVEDVSKLYRLTPEGEAEPIQTAA